MSSIASEPIPIILCIRADKPRDQVLADPDLQQLLEYEPRIECLEVFSRAGGLITELPGGMRLADAPLKPKTEPCRQTFMGLTVQSNGDVQACGCESAVNAPDLIVGNVMRQTLLEIWRGERMLRLRKSFEDGSLNPNCASCDYYYLKPGFHTPEMRARAKSSRRRVAGEVVRHLEPVASSWALE